MHLNELIKQFECILRRWDGDEIAQLLNNKFNISIDYIDDNLFACNGVNESIEDIINKMMTTIRTWEGEEIASFANEELDMDLDYFGDDEFQNEEQYDMEIGVGFGLYPFGYTVYE